MAIAFFSRKRKPPLGVEPPTPAPAARVVQSPARPNPTAYEHGPVVELDADPLVRLLQQKRYGLIAANERKWHEHPRGSEVLRAAGRAMEDAMALVPAGTASLAQTLFDLPGSDQMDIDTEPFYLAVHAVTHSEFQFFVDDGAYENLDLWPEDIWPHLIEFQDLSGASAPKFWRDTRHDIKLADHPVVGISWYEAAAFAAWAGARLPTEAEWQMAASWRIKSTADLLRRFPWGDALDCTRCNLWNSGLGRTAPVSAFAAGAGPNNVLQLIGNVWEWVATDFNILSDDNTPIVGEMPMMGVRGAAFDTYFESQATATFRTGQIALGRTHNTGMRLASDAGTVPLSDLAERD